MLQHAVKVALINLCKTVFRFHVDKWSEKKLSNCPPCFNNINKIRKIYSHVNVTMCYQLCNTNSVNSVATKNNDNCEYTAKQKSFISIRVVSSFPIYPQTTFSKISCYKATNISKEFKIYVDLNQLLSIDTSNFENKLFYLFLFRDYWWVRSLAAVDLPHLLSQMTCSIPPLPFFQAKF